jgi:hypothetical protein
VVMRTPLRHELLDVAEEIRAQAKRRADNEMVGLAERCIQLVERQYAGMEKALDYLNYDGMTRSTVRRERELTDMPEIARRGDFEAR